MSTDRKDQKAGSPAPESAGDTNDAIAQAVERALEKALPIATMAAVSAGNASAQAAANVQATAALAARELKGRRCGKCRQLVAACKDKHVKMVVYPKSELFADLFPGIAINGVWYRSNSRSHAITIPAESDIPMMLQNFEHREESNIKSINRQRRSGTLSPSGSRISRVE